MIRSILLLLLTFSVFASGCVLSSLTLIADDKKSRETAELEITEPPIVDSDREHWSFQPLIRPSIPVASLRDEAVARDVRNPVDAFITAELIESGGFGLAAECERAKWLRRITFDLTGLPPTLDAVDAFVEATTPDAAERVIDRLLASPASGAHLAQHWLDLSHFAESDGFEHDKVREGSWRYRDWVIEAINADLPYDQFVTLQLAGDEIARRCEREQSSSSGHIDAMKTATMFCVAGPDMPDLNDQVERRHNLMNEITSTVGAVILGLQLGCAQCHDHKVDPISQADFYRMRAILETGIPKLLRDKQVKALAPIIPETAAKFFHRGDHRRPGPPIEPNVPRIVSYPSNDYRPNTSSQPRSELCRWIFDDGNPITARVIVNRVWQSHFGRGLSVTPSDFGLSGMEPTHPELLDWLACELREHAWSIKALRRTIVLSQTYRQSSYWDSELTADKLEWDRKVAADPDNNLLGRYPRRRLEGEAIRDAMLEIAELLDYRHGGPSVMPPLPAELVATLLPNQWKASDQAADHYRRSAFIFARRNLRYPIFDCFDRPDAGASCPTRHHSITASQSLLMLNSELSVEIARCVAERIQAVTKTRSEHADQLIRQIFSRHASHEERELLMSFLDSSQSDEQIRLTQAALALLNSNEFVTLD